MSSSNKRPRRQPGDCGRNAIPLAITRGLAQQPAVPSLVRGALMKHSTID